MARGNADFTNVNEQGVAPMIPKGQYQAEILSKKDNTSKNGDPMIAIQISIIGGKYDNQWLWDNIVIPRVGSPAFKIASRTKHFLHCIGEPFEGEFLWDSDRWIGRKLSIMVDIELPNEYHSFNKPFVSQYLMPEIKETIDLDAEDKEGVPF